MAKVLLVEDDATMGSSLDRAMRTSGHDVRWVRTGGSALVDVQDRRPDLVLLDLGLPDMDGVDVCRDLRDRLPSAVIVMLTARESEMDVVVGLEAGADDYLVKPVRLVELMARLRAHVRRAPAGEAQQGEPIRVGDLTVDPRSRRCIVAGQDVRLRPKEFDLLARLISDAGSALSREQLMADVWDENWFGPTKTLDVHVAAVRRKLTLAAEEAGPQVRIALPEITTLRGHGYRLELVP